MYSNLNASRDLMPSEQFLTRLSLPPSHQGPIWQHLFRSDAGLHCWAEGKVGEGVGCCHSDFLSSCFFRAYQSASQTLSCHSLCFSAYPVKFPLKLQMKIAVSLRLLFRNTVTMLSWWFIQLWLSLQVYFSAFQITSGRPFHYEFSKVVVFSFIHICKV